MRNRSLEWKITNAAYAELFYAIVYIDFFLFS